MNIVIIYGKVIEKIDFKFIYDRYNNKNKHTSIAKSKIKLMNNSIVEIYGYDEMADYMYRKLKKDMCIILEGKIDSNMKIRVHRVIL